MENQEESKRKGRILGGLFLLGIGSGLFFKQAGFPMPYWLFRWPVILIILGLFTGIRQNFKGPGWLVLIIIGSVFMADMINPQFALRRFTVPLVIIAIGLVLILRPGTNRFSNYYNRDRYGKNNPDENIPQQVIEHGSPGAGYSKEDFVDSVTFFGSIRKSIVSKNFKGGEMVAVLGGNEIDLTQADFTGTVTMDVTVILGGTKLILPSNWEVKSEMTAVFGGIEDKRQLAPTVVNPGKLLLLRGTSVLGGIEIKNY